MENENQQLESNDKNNQNTSSLIYPCTGVNVSKATKLYSCTLCFPKTIQDSKKNLVCGFCALKCHRGHNLEVYTGELGIVCQCGSRESKIQCQCKPAINDRRPKEIQSNLSIFITPGPGAYNLTQQLKYSKKTKKSKQSKKIKQNKPKFALSTFGTRDAIVDGNLLGGVNKLQMTIPGPGQYKVDSTLEGPKFSFGRGSNKLK